jgi:hypothetical protein
VPSSYLVDTSERELEACRRAFPLHVRVSAHCWKKTNSPCAAAIRGTIFGTMVSDF